LTFYKIVLSQLNFDLINLAVYNHWTGLVDWTGGLTLKIIFTLLNNTYTRLWSYVETLQRSFCTYSHGTNK